MKWKNIIFKQALDFLEEQTIELPRSSSILHIAIQGGKPCIWYECDPSAKKELMKVYCYGTGWSFPADRKQEYIGSVLINGGNGVWHFYIEKK